MDLGPDDVGYVCMPLFHSNAVHGRLGAVDRATARRSVSAGSSARRGWLADVRHYGATYFNYTGKPLAYLLATPERPDDADNPLRVAFGNEGSPQVVDAFARRFGVEVIDAYGATEGGVAVNRDAERAPGALGPGRPATCKVVDEDGNEKPAAGFDAEGRLVNADECVGEIVNTAGVGPFEGYYNNPEANDRDHALRLVLVRRPRLPRRRPATSTSRAATPTGSASTARTSRPARSRRRCAATPTSCSPRSTASPTTRPATR